MLKHSKHIMFFFSLLHISQDKREKKEGNKEKVIEAMLGV